MEHGAHTAPGLGDLLWPTLNFIIFVAVLVRFLRGPVVEYFRARTTRLRDALEAGSRARAEAAALRATIASDMEQLPALRQRLRDDMRAAAELEAANLLAVGRRTADHIRADARLLAEQEIAGARQALRAETIDEAILQATALIRRALQPEDQHRFVRDFVAGAGADS
ncbi:MAG TPA: ATP synthase F0 subunit B [Candidatus Binatia bacterium]|nr:ATP synthase F0 subunit B [Candidatus Binatia bacterium]